MRFRPPCRRRASAAQDRGIRHRRRRRDDGAIIADRQITDGCLTVAIAGFGNADRVAEDKEHDLALLRIYGARGLKALDLANTATKTALDLTALRIRRTRAAAPR
jgi:hypothetical protein